jgi:hypothetical protein
MTGYMTLAGEMASGYQLLTTDYRSACLPLIGAECNSAPAPAGNQAERTTTPARILRPFSQRRPTGRSLHFFRTPISCST